MARLYLPDPRGPRADEVDSAATLKSYWTLSRIAAAAAIAALGMAPSAGAQPASPPEGPRLEVWAGVSVAPSGPSGAVVSSYSPPLLLDGAFTSSGGQAVTFAGRRSAGFAGGANLFLTRHAGIQILADRISADASGVNGPYAFALHYVSRPPPDNALVPVDVSQATPWPATEGSLMQLTLAANGVVRLGRPNRASLTLSGGLSYYRLSGTVQPVGYTTFRLGGHSVLFEDDYRLAVSLEPTGVIGFNGGGDLSVPIGRGVAVMLGYRYFGGPTADVPARVTAILNPDQVIVQQTSADIAQRLALAPTRASVSASRVIVGLKLMR
jgi:hypothetical protein